MLERCKGPELKARITLHEHIGDGGELVRTELRSIEGELCLVVGDEMWPLPEGAVGAVMRRFGKELAAGFAGEIEETLDLGEGRSLDRFRFLSRYDVIARDYVAYRVPHAAPLCEMATSVTAALHHLARRFGESSPSTSEAP